MQSSVMTLNIIGISNFHSIGLKMLVLSQYVERAMVIVAAHYGYYD